uniref:CCHC-type domain-containing protein n=1 Tax=Tanacetum cinerariifolium TaxID=118510 RepID=A0A6L2JI50_TANCI|nr:hypothetical protein [Tanacetum cinerariifolium]
MATLADKAILSGAENRPPMLENYNVKLEKFQVKLHAYLEQHEFHANEVRLMHEQNSDPLALVATHQMTQTYTPGASGSNSMKQRTFICYNCKREGYISKQSDDLDAYDSDCDELNTAKVALMVISSFEQSNVVHSETEITSDSNIIFYSQYVQESQQAAVQNSNLSAQQDALILSMIEQLKTQVVNCTKINLDNKRVNDTLTANLKRYKEQVKVL